MEKTPAGNNQTGEFFPVIFARVTQKNSCPGYKRTTWTPRHFASRFSRFLTDAQSEISELSPLPNLAEDLEPGKARHFLSLTDINQTLLQALFRGIKLRWSERRQKKSFRSRDQGRVRGLGSVPLQSPAILELQRISSRVSGIDSSTIPGAPGD
jgi:hypothetical protein